MENVDRRSGGQFLGARTLLDERDHDMNGNTRTVYKALRKKYLSPPNSRLRKPTLRPVVPKKDPLVADLHGFGPMTRVTTSFGEVPAQALRERDMVRTQNGAYKRIEWIDRIILDDDFLRYHPKAMPILIPAGSLSRGLPHHDTLLAPYQPFNGTQSFSGKIPKLAVDALSRSNIFRKPESIITYTQFHFGRPTSVLVEGLWFDTAP